MNDQVDIRVTVIMPIRNEADFIASSLAAILVQDFPAEQTEILIADGMSMDKTRDIICRIAAENPTRLIQVIDNPDFIVPTGFNRAVSKARGEFIIRVDGHTIIEPDYIRQCVIALESCDADNVGGRMNAVGASTFGQAVAFATSSPFGVGGARFHYSDKNEWVDTVYMGAWHRSVFDRYGLFDEEFIRNQDDEFNYRIRSMGGKILLCSKIRSRYYNRGTLHSLWRQYYQYGYWKVRVMQKHPAQMRIRHFAPMLLVLSVFAFGLLASVSPLFARCAYAIVSLYGLINVIVAIVISYRTKLKYLGHLCLIFPTLHLSYGFGFLHGLISFSWYSSKQNISSADD